VPSAAAAGRLDLGEGGLLGRDVGARYRAQARLLVQDTECVALGGNDALGASIWARSEASRIAAATTLDASER
jgi:hypothetical protein